MNWEDNRQDDIKKLTSEGVIPVQDDVKKAQESEVEIDSDEVERMMLEARPLLMGAVAGAIEDIKPAKDIVEEMVRDAINVFKFNASRISSKL